MPSGPPYRSTLVKQHAQLSICRMILEPAVFKLKPSVGLKDKHLTSSGYVCYLCGMVAWFFQIEKRFIAQSAKMYVDRLRRGKFMLP